MKASAMIAAMILIVVGSLVVGGLLSYISGESYLTKRLNDSVAAFYIAEAGLERALWKTGSDWNDDSDGDSEPDNLFRLNSISETDFGGGHYKVDESWVNPNLEKRIKSIGTYNNEVREVNRNVYLDKEVDFYKHVIASCGTPAGAGKIKGHVKIMGSVYILGEEPFVDTNENSLYDEGEPYRDLNSSGDWGNYLTSDDYAFRMGGNSAIGNNYSNMPGDLKERVPSIYDGDFDWDTLNAELMVKYGKLSLESASASIGAPDVEGVKGYMDSVVVPDGVVVSEGSMYTDEYLHGADKRDMFKDEVRMPSMRDAYTDPATGTFYSSPSNPYTSDTPGGYEKYLYDVATDPVDSDRGVFYDGNLVIQPDSVYDLGDVTDAGKSGLKIDGNGILHINNLIYVNGNLTIDKPAQGPEDEILYTGRGTFYVRGDVVVNLNMRTGHTYKGAFPNEDAMGIMARGNIYFGGANNHVMGAFYAEKTITMTKQYGIAGTVISSEFDMTDQVPEIFQVPALADNQPPYMLTAKFPGLGPVSRDWYETYGE